MPYLQGKYLRVHRLYLSDSVIALIAASRRAVLLAFSLGRVVD